jgi:hypothetical protein
MEGATDYEYESSLKNPVNQVLAVLDPGVDTKAVIQSLNEAGFPEDSIGVLGGQKDAGKLDKASGKHGWLTELAQIGPSFGDLDAHHLKNYARTLEENRTVISVVAEPGEKRRKIADLLKHYGASYINSYGLFSIDAPMTPEIPPEIPIRPIPGEPMPPPKPTEPSPGPPRPPEPIPPNAPEPVRPPDPKGH